MAKIMLVEDDHNLQAIYGDRLIAEGHQIVSAGDGEEALAMAVKEKPDLIIADVMMPKISGFDMLDILRSTPETKDTKVIMMTALSQAEDKARAEKLGADKYLVKSQVTLDDVARIVNEELVADGKAPASSLPPATPAPAPVTPTMQDMSVASAPAAINPAAEPSTPVETPVVTVDSTMPAAPAEPTAVSMPPAGDPAAEPAATPDGNSLVANSEPMQTEKQEVADEITTAMTTPAAAVVEPAAPVGDTVTPAAPAEPTAVSTPPAGDPAAEPTVANDPLANFAPPVPSSAVSNDMHSAAPQTDGNAPALGNGPALGDRVVQPLTAPESATPDINQLYQKEMANETANTAPSDQPPQPPTPPNDPNNIAL